MRHSDTGNMHADATTESLLPCNLTDPQKEIPSTLTADGWFAFDSSTSFSAAHFSKGNQMEALLASFASPLGQYVLDRRQPAQYR